MRAEVRADEVEVEEVTRGRDVQAARLPQPRRAKAPGPASNRSFDLTLPPAESSLERTALRSLFPARIGSGRSNLLAVDLACGRSSSDSGAPNMSSRARSEWLRAFVISQSSSTSLSDSRLTLAAPLSIPSLVVNLTHSSLRGEHRDGFTPRTPRCRCGLVGINQANNIFARQTSLLRMYLVSIWRRAVPDRQLNQPRELTSSCCVLKMRPQPDRDRERRSQDEPTRVPVIMIREIHDSLGHS